MKIKVTQTIDVPRSFYCGNCLRKEQDKKGQWFCGIYNRFLWMAKGKTVKCMACVLATYEAIQKEDA